MKKKATKNKDEEDNELILPKLRFLKDFPLQNREKYKNILYEVFKELPESDQKRLREETEIFVLGYKSGATIIAKDKNTIILNSLAMKMEDERLGLNSKRDYHVLAHEFAHIIKDHKESTEETERQADELAKEWGFEYNENKK
ncbi:MAG: hypothetical protein JSW60_08710 [Thermoplasmatales archaeon]|nr:MAG: hypothetical protein JSW60_08710 [Thermoplasmatales archaeon]